MIMIMILMMEVELIIQEAVWACTVDMRSSSIIYTSDGNGTARSVADVIVAGDVARIGRRRQWNGAIGCSDVHRRLHHTSIHIHV